MLFIKSIHYVLYLALLMVIGMYVFSPSESFEARANRVLLADTKTMDGMDDAPPTNPTRTNRFPTTYSRPVATPTPQGVILNSDKMPPSSTPSHSN
jgi:hypothetical protein